MGRIALGEQRAARNEQHCRQHNALRESFRSEKQSFSRLVHGTGKVYHPSGTVSIARWRVFRIKPVGFHWSVIGWLPAPSAHHAPCHADAPKTIPPPTPPHP